MHTLPLDASSSGSRMKSGSTGEPMKMLPSAVQHARMCLHGQAWPHKHALWKQSWHWCVGTANQRDVVHVVAIGGPHACMMCRQTRRACLDGPGPCAGEWLLMDHRMRHTLLSQGHEAQAA